MKRFIFLLLLLGFGLAPQTQAQTADPAATANTGTLRTDPVKQLYGCMVKLSEFGSEDVAYLTLPPTAPIGGVVLIHEWWGLNDYIRQTADKLANEGFIVVAVDLYNGQVATDPDRAAELMHDLQNDSALKTVAAAVNLLHQSPRFHCDRVAALGWCMGGGVCLRSAIGVKGLDAAVVYYGPVDLEEKDLNKLKIPILGIYGRQDKFVLPQDVQTLDDLLTKLNKPHEFHWFDGVHAFANPSNAHYNQDFADQAWKLSVDFLKTHLSPPPPKKSVIDQVFN